MFGKVLSVACLAAVFGVTPALADLRGPAELPPPGFKGQQYVDSRGCVFLRAGYGGQVSWVPRVTRDRKQLCGYPASGGTVEVATETPAPKAEDKVAAAPAPKVETKPKVVAKTPTAAPKVEVAAAPVVVERPVTATERAAAEVKGTAVADAGGGEGYRLACPADTPVAERFEIRGGGSKVMCTRGDGSLDGANFPVLVAGSTDGHPVGFDAWVAAGVDPRAPTAAPATGSEVASGATGKVTIASKSARYPEPVPPPGYKLAWKDDRLNPNRGKQTVDGVLDQDEIWTRTVPMVLRVDWPYAKKPIKIVVRHRDGSTTEHRGVVVREEPDGRRVVAVSGSALGTIVLSSKSEPKAVVKAADKPETKVVAKAEPKPEPKAVARGRLMVQVGTFGVAANADGAAGRLRGLGLPVARGKLKGGKLQVVYAGPFASAGDAKAALAAARRAGFGDAVIVQ